MPQPQLTPEQDKAAHRAAVEFMLMDRDLGQGTEDLDYSERRHAELTAELEEIFGPDALENSAEYFTGGKFTSDEIVLCAATEWDTLKKVFAGVQF